MARRRLGQHFLLDPSILDRILDEARVAKDDLVLEIGPGLGRMTELLSERCRKVLAIELDDALAAKLADRLGEDSSVEVVHADCLKYPLEELPPFRVVANIPYYITTPILFRLLEPNVKLLSMTLTMQKEVADRLSAHPGTKAYGALSVTVQSRMEIRKGFTISRKAFSPPPEVDSSVITLTPRSPALLGTDELDQLTKMVRSLFSTRRKTLYNNLKRLAPLNRIPVILSELGIEPNIRPENLDIPSFIRLVQRLAAEK